MDALTRLLAALRELDTAPGSLNPSRLLTHPATITGDPQPDALLALLTTIQDSAQAVLWEPGGAEALRAQLPSPGHTLAHQPGPPEFYTLHTPKGRVAVAAPVEAALLFTVHDGARTLYWTWNDPLATHMRLLFAAVAGTIDSPGLAQLVAIIDRALTTRPLALTTRLVHEPFIITRAGGLGTRPDPLRYHLALNIQQVADQVREALAVPVGDAAPPPELAARRWFGRTAQRHVVCDERAQALRLDDLLQPGLAAQLQQQNLARLLQLLAALTDAARGPDGPAAEGERVAEQIAAQARVTLLNARHSTPDPAVVAALARHGYPVTTGTRSPTLSVTITTPLGNIVVL